MHVGPVIVERHAPWIRMPNGFEAEPILNLAFLPVDSRQFRGQRLERGMVRGNGNLQNHPGRLVRPIKNIIIIENAFRLHPVLGENSHKSCLVLGQEVLGYCGDIGAVQQNCDLTVDRFFHGADLLRETLVKFFED